MSGKITITKVDQLAERKPVLEEKKPEVRGGMKKTGKTMKTFPRGVLKSGKQKVHLRSVADPAKSPPLKKTMRKHTIQLMTDKGIRRHRKTLRKQISGMSDQHVKDLVSKHNLLKNANTPVSIMREMVEGGAIAGFISLK
jgi:hypothetical protein